MIFDSHGYADRLLQESRSDHHISKAGSATYLRPPKLMIYKVFETNISQSMSRGFKSQKLIWKKEKRRKRIRSPDFVS
jgi:hypothetical protein